MKATFLCTVSLILAPLLVAADCPAAPDHSAAFAELTAKANAAQTEADGRVVSGLMWELWADAPDDVAQEILDRGMRRLRNSDFVGAVEDFDRLVAYCPAYAEGYNQRAFARFLQGDFPVALEDLEVTLELSPNHVAARAGLALTYMQLGEIPQARTHLRTALDLNPWLSERHLLAKGGQLAPDGEDI